MATKSKKPKATKSQRKARQVVLQLNFDVTHGRRLDENDIDWLVSWVQGTFENATGENMCEDGFPPCLEKLPPIVSVICVAHGTKPQ